MPVGTFPWLTGTQPGMPLGVTYQFLYHQNSHFPVYEGVKLPL